jgi:hypothetical protein
LALVFLKLTLEIEHKWDEDKYRLENRIDNDEDQFENRVDYDKDRFEDRVDYDKDRIEDFPDDAARWGGRKVQEVEVRSTVSFTEVFSKHISH